LEEGVAMAKARSEREEFHRRNDESGAAPALRRRKCQAPKLRIVQPLAEV
jgi:hypothetical protein